MVAGRRAATSSSPPPPPADLVVDDETWEITDVLVDSRDWLPGKLLIISPAVIERIDWPEKKVHLRLAREDILGAPEVQL